MARALTAFLCGRRLWQAPGACVRAKDCPQRPPPGFSPVALLLNVFREKGRGFVDGEDRQDRQKQVRAALHQLIRLGDHARGRSIPPHEGGWWPSAPRQPSPLRLIERAETVTLFCTRFTVPYRTLMWAAGRAGPDTCSGLHPPAGRESAIQGIYLLFDGSASNPYWHTRVDLWNPNLGCRLVGSSKGGE